MGDYRRQTLGQKDLPDDYFWSYATEETQALRNQILETCKQDLLDFFNKEKGQVGIYDAVNPTSADRRAWKGIMENHGIQTIFVESLCNNQEIIEQNVRNVKISSPDVRALSTPPSPQTPIQELSAQLPSRLILPPVFSVCWQSDRGSVCGLEP